MNQEYYVYCFFDSEKKTKIENSILNCCFLFEPFYIGKNRAVIQIIENNVIEFESVKEAAKRLNLTTKSVIARCSSKARYDDLNLLYKNDYEKGIIKTKLKKGNGEKKIFKLDDRNQILETFQSLSATAKSEKISRSHLSKSINKTKIKGYLYATICHRRAD